LKPNSYEKRSYVLIRRYGKGHMSPKNTGEVVGTGIVMKKVSRGKRGKSLLRLVHNQRTPGGKKESRLGTGKET